MQQLVLLPVESKTFVFRSGVLFQFASSSAASCRPQVRERDLPMVMHTLSSEFTLLRVVNGETVAAHDLGVSNGFVKPKLGGLLQVPPFKTAA